MYYSQMSRRLSTPRTPFDDFEDDSSSDESPPRRVPTRTRPPPISDDESPPRGRPTRTRPPPESVKSAKGKTYRTSNTLLELVRRDGPGGIAGDLLRGERYSKDELLSRTTIHVPVSDKPVTAGAILRHLFELGYVEEHEEIVKQGEQISKLERKLQQATSLKDKVRLLEQQNAQLKQFAASLHQTHLSQPSASSFAPPAFVPVSQNRFTSTQPSAPRRTTGQRSTSPFRMYFDRTPQPSSSPVDFFGLEIPERK
mgnify:CR=1 FL=1